MADQTERIVLEVDEKGAVTALSSANKQVAALEVQFARAGQTAEQRLLAKIATLQQRMSGDPLRLKELDVLQQKVLSRVAENAGKAGDKFAQLGSKIKEAIENPLHAAGSAVETFLGKLGPAGALVAGTIAALAAATIKGFEFAKEIGHLGDQIEDTSIRMGLTTRETQQFTYAMKYAGGDISSLENIMRKLSQEIDGGGKNLQDIGVKFRDVSTGAILPMSQIVLGLSDRLNAIPDVSKRNTEAIKILGRAAMEVLPDLLEFREGMRRSGDVEDTFLTDEELRRAKSFHQSSVEIDQRWDAIKRHFKELAATLALPVMERVFGSGKNAPSRNDVRNANSGQRLLEDVGALPTPSVPKPQIPAPTAEYLNRIRTDAINAAAAVKRGNSLIDAVLGSDAEQRLEVARKKLSDLRGDLEKMRGLNPEATASQRAAVIAQQKTVDGIEAEIKARKDLEALRKEIEGYQKQADEAGLSNAEKILYHQDELIKRVEQLKGSTKDLAAIASATAKLLAVELTKAMQEFDDYYQKLRRERDTLLNKPSDRQFSEWEWGFKADKEIPKINADADRAMKRAEGEKAMRLAELTAMPGHEVEAITRAYQIRLELAQQIREEELAAIPEEATEGEKRIARAKAEADVRKEMHAAAIDAEVKLAELQRRRFDELRSSMENMIDAAFAGGKGLLDSLKRMAEAVFLTPIKQGISAVMAQALMPVMYGRDGTGGIMGRITGAFGGGGINNVRLVNGAVPVVITNASGGASSTPGGVASSILGGWDRAAGTGGEALGTGGSTSGLVRLASGLWRRGPVGAGGVSLDSLWNLPTSQRYSLAQMSSLGAVGGGPGGTSGFAGPVQPQGIGGWAQQASGYSGFKGILSNLGNIGYKPARYAMDEGGNMTQIAGARGVGGVAGGAMLAGGGILAADGLRRGGWLGVGETTAGGALIGAKFGGPLGAAIGAGVGFVAGLIRLGIKSAAEKVQEKVRTIYGLSINKSMAQQIVEIANSKYAKNLDMAVRSTEAKELLRLYAQTMGQKVPASLMADKARAASLIESGGALYQGAQYDNGQAYTYASSLRTYGGVQSDTLPTASPSAGAVTVHLDKDQTVDLWRTGTTSAIQSNSRLVAQSAYRGNAAGSSRFGVAQMAFAPSAIAQ